MTLSSPAARKPRALILSGEGSKGAWQVGVLNYLKAVGLFRSGFDIICGSGVGAINSSVISQFDKKDFYLGIGVLHDLWETKIVSTSSVWNWRRPKYIAGLWNKSFGTSKNLRKIIEKNVDPRLIMSSDVKLHLPAVNLVDGNLKYFDCENSEYIIDSVLAASAFPAFFDPVKIDNGLYIDGSIRDVSPLKKVIKSGAEEILIIMSNNPYMVKPKARINNVCDVAFRAIEIATKEIMLSDVQKCIAVNRRIELGDKKVLERKQIKIKMIYPIHYISSPLNFSKDHLERLMSKGYMDAEFIFNKSLLER